MSGTGTSERPSKKSLDETPIPKPASSKGSGEQKRIVTGHPPPMAAAVSQDDVSQEIERTLPARSRGAQTLTVSFDDTAWRQLDEIAQKGGLTKAAVLRRSLRLLAWFEGRLAANYKIALLKEGESPVLVELV